MNKYVLRFFRILISVILLQTLRFKFTAHPDSVYIFSKVGLEPFGRIFIGILELVAAILILIPKTIWLGALLTFGIISGAVLIHLTILGIQINNDGGLLFFMALIVLILSGIIIWNERRNIPFFKKLFLY
ncbi:DoxX family protein [Lutibacter maritimus]|uniref:DoxX-like family protein n=1 Tax=Lutibacter maritimus TaxID=593133 RepID=A0A1I6SE26_9FLAO|nr:DoxX family protein [Lutibacter maritimus]SFS75187.1 DoxX-like family protein [Lutibacter maritimus]